MQRAPGGLRPRRRPRAAAIAVSILTAVTLLTGPTLVAPAQAAGDRPSVARALNRLCEHRSNTTYRRLLGCLTAPGALRHLEAFQQIAEANGGTRSSGTPGYRASVDYVVEQLEEAGYEPEVQAFDFFFYDESSTVTLAGEELEPYSFLTGEGDYNVMTYSGSGNVATSAMVPTTDVVVPIGDEPPNTSTSGCEPEDFEPAPDDTDAVALVQRGECPFLQKALNAQGAGYDAVLIFNEGQPGTDEVEERRSVVLGTLGEEAVGTLEVPVLGISYELGVSLVEDPREIAVDVEVVAEERESYNVTADLPGRTDDNVVVLGGHLDSVTEGAGINDNGSGSAAVLETALKMANVRPENTVRFAWWGSEEFGLLGSYAYVESLAQEELDAIALYLNFDMVGSPNYVRFVYDGDQSTFEAPVPVPEGSAEIEAVFRTFFERRGLASEDTEFSGRSDYEAFILNDIPAGGLFTGAEGTKTEEQAAEYGGVAGLAYDPCYHEPCDDLVPPNDVAELQEAYGWAVRGNVNLRALGEHLDAIGYAALTFAFSTEEVNDRAGRRVPGLPLRTRWHAKHSGWFDLPDPAGRHGR